MELHAKADTMNTDLEVITLREEKQTALEVMTPFLITPGNKANGMESRCLT